MSGNEFKSFRFTDSNDPSDEMLHHLMQKVAKQVMEENKLAEKQYFENIINEVKFRDTYLDDFINNLNDLD